MDALIQDLRYALRQLTKSPGFTTVAVLTLGLGIGANTAIFSVVNAVLLRPLPYPHSEQLATWGEKSKDGVRLPSYPTFKDWQEQNRVLDLAYVRGVNTLTPTEDGPARIGAAYVTPGFFAVLGVLPLIGRFPLEDDDRSRAGRVAVVSYGLWQTRFGGEPSAIGRSITLDSVQYTVIGVLASSFDVPNWADIWIPLSALPTRDRALVERGFHADGQLIGRLRPGVTYPQAQAEMDVIATRLATAYPAENRDWTSTVAFPLSQLFGDAKPRLLMALVVVGLVLLVACANIANLLLARGESHGSEIGIRSALGASRSRLLSGAMAESVLLTFSGGTLGVWAAGITAGTLKRTASSMGLPRVDEITLDGRVLGFTLVLCALATMVFGVLPALKTAWSSPTAILQDRTAGAGGGRGRSRLKGALIAAEVALASMLLIGAGLLTRSFWGLTRVDPGFNAEQLITVDIFPPSPKYDSVGPALGLFRRLTEEVAAVPGVRRVALANGLPFRSPGIPTPVVIGGQRPAGDAEATAAFRVVSAGYFDTMGIQIIKGREFGESDMVPGAPVVIVNQAFARRFLPGDAPLGRQVTVLKRSQARGDFGQPVSGEVIGLVNDVKAFGLDQPARPEVYLPYPTNLWTHMFMVMRVAGDTQQAIGALRRAILKVEPNIALSGAGRFSGFGFRTMDKDVLGSLRPQRFSMLLVGLVALTALFLSAIGVYGVTSYIVAARTREIAVRMALGAKPGEVWRATILQGMRLVILGLGLGVAGALTFGQVIGSLLYGVAAHDLLTFGGTAGFFALVGLIACHVPARRAIRVDPMVALRSE